MPSQRIQPGRLEAAWRKQLRQLAERRAIEKIWSKQPALWKEEEAHGAVIRNRLGWLDVLEPMQRESAVLQQFADSIRKFGLTDIVLLGMGGSSLAAEVFSQVFPPATRCRFFLLDSTDPSSVLGVERTIKLRETLFIVASKSGKTIETLSQFEYFHDRLAATGAGNPGANFVAITDAGSHLERLAQERGFRRTFLNPGDIGGRYSALSYFGLVPAALWGVDLEAVLDVAIEMRRACAPGAPAESNPALGLGALLGAGAESRCDKLYVVARPLAPLGDWIEQLIAESTGKEGTGVVTIAGEVPGALEIYENDGIVVSLELEGESPAAGAKWLKALASRGVPLVEIRLAGPEELGAEFFKWEVATAVAAAVLRINPFDEPNVQESKDNTGRILEEFRTTNRMPMGVPRLVEHNIELYVEGPARNRMYTRELAPALRTFLADHEPGGYLGLLAYLDRNAEFARQLEEMRWMLRDPLEIPVLLGFGPRYLHSTGQLFKGGPPQGMFIEITAAHPEDTRIPGATYTFGELMMAQALGDIEALARREKPALRLHLKDGPAAGLPQLRKMLAAALASLA